MIPPWLGKPRLQRQCAGFLHADSHSEHIPRGAYAPRSCVAVRTSAGETTIFAMHQRTFDQERQASARRNYRYRTYNGASTNSRQTADGV